MTRTTLLEVPVPLNDEVNARDLHRPKFHYLPRTGWINDPNGLIYWRGQYHLFFQHNPGEARWDAINWGHAVSDDLVHWRHLPTALAPDQGPDSPDASGVWSGCAVADGEELRLIYTAARGYDRVTDQSDIQIRSASSLDGVEFSKDQDAWVSWPWGTPVGGQRLTGFRDPWVWREGEGWKMLVGAGISGQGGTALLYGSADLKTWSYLGPLAVGSEQHPIWTGTVWECPQLLDFENGTVLTMSVWHERKGAYVAYLSGGYDGRTLDVTDGGRLDWGDTYYAAQALRDERGEWVLIGWLPERRTAREQLDSGWSGAIALPRTLHLANGQITQQPHARLQQLRRRHHPARTFTLSGEQQPSGLQGDALEILLMVSESSERCGLLVKHEGNSSTEIAYDPVVRQVIVQHPPTSDGQRPAPLTLPLPETDGPQLRVFFDASVLEIFAGGQVLTTRVSPVSSTVDTVLFADGEAELKVEAWELAGIW